MEKYQQYAEKAQSLGKKLTGTSGLKLSYIKVNSEWLDGYTNYISNKFFWDKKQISQYDIEERISVIESVLQEYDTILNEIDTTQDMDPDLKKFFVKRIEESRTKAEIAKRSALFEAEKSGYDIRFQWFTFEIKKNQEKIDHIWLWTNYEETKQTYLQEINDLQTKVYGPRITDCEDEKSIILSLCNKTYQKNKDKLTPQEYDLFTSFLDKFKNNITPNVSKDIKKIPWRWNLSMETIMEGTQHIKEHFYPNIQRLQTIAKGKTWYSSLLSKKTREYPDQKEDAFNKILTTIGHEDGGHMIRWDNQEKNGMIIAWSWYEDIEEGITKLNEWLLKYSLDEYPLVPTDTFIAVFIGENYNFEDTYRLIMALKKIQTNDEITKEKNDSIAKTSFNLAQRVKCYYPRDEQWSNRKDVIYFRGEKKIIEYLKSLPNDEERAEFYRKAMSAKVSFEDIFTLDNLFKKLGTTPENINQNKLVDKVFNVKLQEWAWAFSQKDNEQGKKNIEENLLKWDFRFNGMEQYTQDEKRALVHLFTIVKYKKYRGKYIQQKKWDELAARDHLKKWSIISFPTWQWVKKAKVLSSSLDELKIVFQHEWRYSWWEVISIKKKDIQQLWDVRILNNPKT